MTLTFVTNFELDSEEVQCTSIIIFIDTNTCTFSFTSILLWFRSYGARQQTAATSNIHGGQLLVSV